MSEKDPTIWEAKIPQLMGLLFLGFLARAIPVILGLLLLYGIFVIVFRHAFGVELWNPFG